MSKEQLSRRDFLKLAGLGTATAALTWFGLDQLFTGGEFRQLVTDWWLDITNAKATELNPHVLSEKCVNRGRAFMIVHKGYLAKQGWIDGGYGSYSGYQKSLNQLSEYLQVSGEPTLLVMENRVYQSGNFVRDPLLPTCSSLIITRNTTGEVQHYVFSNGERFRQSLSQIIMSLKNSGVTTLCCAGEMAYKGSLFGYGTNACLSTIVQNFVGSFDIKGVANCVYPLKPPEHPNEIVHELYYDTVPIPQL